MLKLIKITLISVLVMAVVLCSAAVYAGRTGAMGRVMNKVESHAPYEISRDAQMMHNALTVMDWHCDALLWEKNLLKRSSNGHVDFPRLREGNVSVQMFTVVTKSPSGQNYDSNTGESDNITLLAWAQGWPKEARDSLLARALYQAKKLHDFQAEKPEEVMIVRTKKDLEKALAARKDALAADKTPPTASLIGLEGCHALENKLKNVQALYDAGYRMIGLLHFFDNEVGGSLHGVSSSGLTPFGRDVVRKCEELNMIIDLAHSSPQVAEDVLAMATRPVVVSHTGIYGVCPKKRNFQDALMKKIADKGGIIGIGYWDAVCDTTPEGVVKSIRYAIDLVGVDHVALGSDYDGSVTTRFDASELAILTQTMMDNGFTDAEIAKVMGGNSVRFLMENLPD
ncbi:dipeptidase [Desulfatibacillum aliphaticivorans]|uniref:dipeptidase n=1 Tax=Desulfatibacillum aliphaticivorans TaxID=218208 RepID=UPI000420DCDC|nr:dipeptidase [Desulfatibacillum aliphaticivorans]